MSEPPIPSPSSLAKEPPATSGSLVRWEGGSVRVTELVRSSRADPDYDLVLWVESGSERVVGVRFARSGDLEGVAEDLLQEAIRHPMSGAPGRPAEVLVTDEALGASIRQRMALQGIRVRVVEECQTWKAVVREFGAFLAARWPGRSYLAGKGMTPECVGRFFAAAAAFYQSAPWRVLDESPIELHLAGRPGPLYAVVLGQSRPAHGLTLYLSDASFRQRDTTDPHPIRARGMVAVTFDREDGIPPAMLEERRTHRWPLAGPAAFPLPYRRLVSGTMREPEADELEVLSVTLQAVAEFTSRRAASLRDGQRVVEAVQVHGAFGDSIARLTFPAVMANPTNED
jgi:hypothetical protein